MKNTSVKITAVLVALASVFAVASTACGKDDKLLFKKNGKIFYRQSVNDNAYELVTDSKGETVVDAQGNLLWKVTDANGENHTMPVSYPSYLNEGGKISCQEFSMKLPGGYENIGGDCIMLRNTKKGTQIDYSLFEPAGEDDENNSAKARAEMVKNVFAKETEKGHGTVTMEDVQIGGRDAVRVIIDMNKTEKQAYMEAYYIDSVNGVMSFTCACDYKDKGKIDFKAILDVIEYRV